MTELNIITTDLDSAECIISILETESLVIHGFIEKESSHRLPAKWKITAQARATMFDRIVEKVMDIASQSVVTIYSKPIVNMQWSQADTLLKTSKSA